MLATILALAIPGLHTVTYFMPGQIPAGRVLGTMTFTGTVFPVPFSCWYEHERVEWDSTHPNDLGGPAQCKDENAMPVWLAMGWACDK